MVVGRTAAFDTRTSRSARRKWTDGLGAPPNPPAITLLIRCAAVQQIFDPSGLEKKFLSAKKREGTRRRLKIDEGVNRGLRMARGTPPHRWSSIFYPQFFPSRSFAPLRGHRFWSSERAQ